MNAPLHRFQFKETDSNIPVVEGFQEVVFSVQNLGEQIEFFKKIAGWEVICQQTSQRNQTQFWGLPQTTTLDQAVLGNPGDHSGFLRLVKFKNIDQRLIRSNGKAWDSGGIYDINLRASNLKDSFEQFVQNQWLPYSDPIRYQFGDFDVEEVILNGPAGINIAMMQRFAPPLQGFPNLRKLSHVFNSTHICKDIERTYDFFVNQLGFKVYMHVKSIDRVAGPNVLGIPYEQNAKIELPVYIVHPHGLNMGSVEFIQLNGLSGRDFSADSHPPNLGILMLRFPVSDVENYAEIIKSRGVSLKVPIQTLELAPYGHLKVFAIQSPDGVWLEFMEQIMN